ncbi:MAG: serine/threonine protein kinase [Myxococcales bacterium]|nr:serine/threonine protein kinase [Myxococcales bacterium]
MVEQLGNYRIVRRLGTGGMAEAYLARHSGLEGVDRLVVLKRVHPQYANDDEFVTMFLDEARLMAALSHPNIAQVFDLGVQGDSYFLVMEHVRGPTLETILAANQRLGRAGLPIEVALPLLLQIAEGLLYVHEARDEFGRPLHVVHRDLNPTNVMVAYNGAVKLIDFGIAKAAIRVYETRQGVVKGTYGYIAPEQLDGKRTIDARADLFSLGVLMYEVCTAELPFGPGTAPNLLERILNGQYRRPSRVNPDFPAALEPLIERCLAPDPDARFSSMREFITHLSEYMASRRILPTMVALGEFVRGVVPDPEGMEPIVVRRVAPGKAAAPRATEREDVTQTVNTVASASRAEPVPDGDDEERTVSNSAYRALSANAEAAPSAGGVGAGSASEMPPPKRSLFVPLAIGFLLGLVVFGVAMAALSSHGNMAP